jgi:putative transposase
MISFNKRQEALLDDLLKDYYDPKYILGEHGLLKHITQRLVERALETERVEHLGYEPHARESQATDNSRNGKTPKTVQSD